MPLLALSGISKSFGTNVVLTDVSLAVEPGEVVAIIGRSGSGKSTLLRCINGLEVPDKGAIEFDGRPLDWSSKGLQQLRLNIGIVFQSFNLFPHLSVERNVTLGLTEVKRIDATSAKAIAHRVLKLVGLESKIAAYPQQLSGGQQQRVAIARALAMDPRLVLLDEITASLDPELVGEVIGVLDDLATNGMTMVLVTHEMGFAREVGDRVLFMEDGRIIEQGTPDKIFEYPEHSRTQTFLSKII
jgi:ABC-type polar amino acid transport system ATPase subunit